MTLHPTLIIAVVISLCTLPACTSVNTLSDSTHSKHTDLDTKPMENRNQVAMPVMDHSAVMPSMDMSSMQGGSAPTDARDPHAFSDGYDFGPIPRPKMGDEHYFGSLMINRLEIAQSSDNSAALYDLHAWYGRDYNRAVLKAEGTYFHGDFEEVSTELFWGHALASFWDMQFGLRFDGGAGPNRAWLAFGVQGLSPYWIEMEATGYIGNEGHSMLNLEVEYELLITQKIILQPRAMMVVLGKKDAERGVGSGLSEIAIGARLRYEIRREFAPYLGVEWTGTNGDTANFARDAGVDTSEVQAVAGVRFWF